MVEESQAYVFKVGDKVLELDPTCKDYGVGTVVATYTSFGDLRISFANAGTFHRSMNDPEIILCTPLTEALF
jgi:hypothetical protein